MAYTEADYLRDKALRDARDQHWRDNRDFTLNIWKTPGAPADPARTACTPEVRARLKRYELETLKLAPENVHAQVRDGRVWVDGVPVGEAEAKGRSQKGNFYGTARINDVEYKWYGKGPINGDWAKLTRADYKPPVRDRTDRVRKSKARPTEAPWQGGTYGEDEQYADWLLIEEARESGSTSRLKAASTPARRARLKHWDITHRFPAQFRAAVEISLFDELEAVVPLAWPLGPAEVTREEDGRRFGVTTVCGQKYAFAAEKDGSARFWKR